MRILIVEDDWDSGRLLEAILSPFGQCELAFDGAHAVECFSEALAGSEPYDLICMDIMMPHTNGLEALMQIRKMEADHAVAPGQEVKVIMVTAADSPADVRQAMYEGAAASYLVKPIYRQDLVQELKNLGLLEMGAGELEKIEASVQPPEDEP